MFDQLKNIITETATLVPLVIGLTQACKMAFALADRYIPLTAVLFGVIITNGIDGISIYSIIAGIAVGLGAVGLYEFGKTTVLGK